MNRRRTLLIVAVLVVGRPAFAQDAGQTPPREADLIAALTAEFVHCGPSCPRPPPRA